MTLEELSKLYNLSCLNAHHLLDELYEACHTDEGEPKASPDEIKAIKQRFLTKIRQELELIQSAADEASDL
jgi:uncharacterized protein (DUF2267 family)